MLFLLRSVLRNYLSLHLSKSRNTEKSSTFVFFLLKKADESEEVINPHPKLCFMNAPQQTQNVVHVKQGM